MKKHKHDFADRAKGQNVILKCSDCGNFITKGKRTRNGAFGRPKWTR